MRFVVEKPEKALMLVLLLTKKMDDVMCVSKWEDGERGCGTGGERKSVTKGVAHINVENKSRKEREREKEKISDLGHEEEVYPPVSWRPV